MKKIIIFSNSDSHFYHHLLPIALGSKDLGYDVKIITNVGLYHERITSRGLEIIPIEIKRGSLNIFDELLLVIRVIKIIYTEKPDILHNFTIKPIFYGTIAGFIARTPKIINNFLGMGALFISDRIHFKAIRIVICKILAMIGKCKNMLFIAQNSDDQNLLQKLAIASPDKIIKQCSVGVDLKEYPRLPEAHHQDGKIILALVGRMLVDKGVVEFVKAAKILIGKGLNAEFWLVGSPDKENPSSISEADLRKYERKGYVKYLGHQNNMQAIWSQVDVAVLPSYREGLSRSILEAGASGRAVITTDAPGGRDLITNGQNGLLVEVKNVQDLVNSMEKLIIDHDLRKKIAGQLFEHVKNSYQTPRIMKEVVKLYS